MCRQGFKLPMASPHSEWLTGSKEIQGECAKCIRTKDENSVAMVMIHSNRRWEKENVRPAHLQERLSMLVYVLEVLDSGHAQEIDHP